MKESGKYKANEPSANKEYPETDKFVEGKIGSTYMVTIEGQPHLDDFVEVVSDDRKGEIRGKTTLQSKN